MTIRSIVSKYNNGPFNSRSINTLFGIGWRKQKLVTVISTPSSNFQVRVVLNSTNVLYSDFNENGSDIRFTSSLSDDPEQSFSYWIESWNTSGNSVIWVKVPTQSTTTFYMFYNNPEATAISSINDTMESGLRFRYYQATASFTNILNGGTCGAPNNDWGSGTVSVCGVGNRADSVTIMWDGWVIPTGTGNHTFFGTSDDGQRLYVNSNLILNNWVDRGPTENNATVNMTDILPKRIQYDWYENGGGAVARLGWTPVGGSKVYPIPSSNLRSPKYSSSYNDPYSYAATISNVS